MSVFIAIQFEFIYDNDLCIYTKWWQAEDVYSPVMAWAGHPVGGLFKSCTASHNSVHHLDPHMDPLLLWQHRNLSLHVGKCTFDFKFTTGPLNLWASEGCCYYFFFFNVVLNCVPACVHWALWPFWSAQLDAKIVRAADFGVSCINEISGEFS